jgi:hypothetical protein
MTHARRSAYALDEVPKQLEAGRDGAIRVQAGSKPFGDQYNTAKAVTESIDELVEELTGDRERF